MGICHVGHDSREQVADFQDSALLTFTEGNNAGKNASLQGHLDPLLHDVASQQDGAPTRGESICCIREPI